MTIEIVKQTDQDETSLARVIARLRRLPHDEIVGLDHDLRRLALEQDLKRDLNDPSVHIWVGREKGEDTGIAVLKHLTWDSEILGVSCASIAIYLSDCDQSSRQATASLLIHQALLRCRTEDIHFVSTKVSSDQFAQIHALEDLNFRLMDAEMILRYHGQRDEIQEVPGVNFVKKRNEEVPGLSTMGKLFHMSRFFADPKLGPKRADRLWQESVTDSCRGHADSFLVAMENDKAKGFVTFMDNPDFFGLGGPSIRTFFHVGIAQEAQGKGLGTALIHAALQDSNSFDHIMVETQSRNTGALALYQKCGFRILGSRFAFHLWMA